MSRDADAFRLTRRDSIYQTLKCVEVEEAPAIDPCCGLRSKCTVFRTKNKLPDLLEDSMGPRISMVAPIDNMFKSKGSDKQLLVISAKDWLKKLDNPWSKFNMDGYVIYNDGYLYFPNRNWKLVLVEGIFLEDISSYNSCSEDNSCKRFLDNKVFAPERQVAEAIGKSIEELAGVYKRMPEQVTIDKNDNNK